MRKKVENIHHVQQFPLQTKELACPHAMLEKKERGGCYNLLKSMLGVKQHGIREVLRMNKNING